ncbi:MAG: sugar transferase [Parasporobacterium sp.]|nr:sugar transferase [Parasporobacterium sp.]
MYSRKSITKQNVVLLLLDCISIFISLNISVFIRYKINSTDYYYASMHYSDIYGLLLIFGFSYFLQVVIFNLNLNFRNNGILKEFLVAVKINIFLAVLATFLMYILRVIRLDFSRGIFVIFLITNCLITFALHRLYYNSLKASATKGYNRRQLVLITNMEKVDYLIYEAFSEEQLEYKVCAIALLDRDNYLDVKKVDGIPIIDAQTELIPYCISQVVDEVFIKVPDYQMGEINNSINQIVSMGITIHVNVDLFENDLAAQKTITSIGNVFAVTFANNFMTFRQRFAKRLLDIAGGLVGSAIALVLTVIFGPLIFIESPGPIFFKQQRVGRNGRFFNIYKFRSMYPDAEARKAELMEKNDMHGFMFKMENDPRITKIGKFLRKTSLDEFPQFFNVLKGDMSLVGTRPPTVDEYEHYESHHKMRLSAKPGLTGMWQVSGRSRITDFEDVVKLDVWYINNYTLGLDIKIIFKTIGAVLHRDGAE